MDRFSCSQDWLCRIQDLILAAGVVPLSPGGAWAEFGSAPPRHICLQSCGQVERTRGRLKRRNYLILHQGREKVISPWPHRQEELDCSKMNMCMWVSGQLQKQVIVGHSRQFSCPLGWAINGSQEREPCSGTCTSLANAQLCTGTNGSASHDDTNTH